MAPRWSALAPERRQEWVLVGLALLLTLPFLDKPSAIDEEVHHFIGRFLRHNPGRPFDWVRAFQPFHNPAPGDYFLHPHPPLWHYFIATWTAVAGDAVTIASRLPGPVLYAMSAVWVVRLARRLSPRPFSAALLFVTSPIAVLAAQDTFMLELPLLVLAAGSCYAAAEAGGRRSTKWAIGAGLLAAAAALVKYTGLLLWPGLLLLIHACRAAAPYEAHATPAPSGLAQEGATAGSTPATGSGRLLWAAALAASIPFWLFQVWMAIAYGRSHLLFVLTNSAEIGTSSPAVRAAATLTALGGVALFPGATAWLALRLPGPGRLAASWGGALLAVLVVLATGAPAGTNARAVAYSPVEMVAVLVLASAGGATLLGMARGSGAGQGRRRALLLLVGGVVVPQAAGLTFASARYLVPALPALVILLTGLPPLSRWATRILAAAGAALALSLAWVDARFAAAQLQGAVAAVRDFPVAPGQIRWACAEWGLRDGLERHGFGVVHPLARPGSGTGVVVEPRPGDLVVRPAVGPGDPACDRYPMEQIAVYRYASVFPVRIMSHEAHAGYYGDDWGLLPFAFSTLPLEEVRVYRVLPAAGAPAPAPGR